MALFADPRRVAACFGKDDVAHGPIASPSGGQLPQLGIA